MKTGVKDPWLYALRLLASRDYTVASLRRKLSAKGCCEKDISSAIERLSDERFLDDRRYAERFIESSLSSGRYVGYRLRQELKRRGICNELVNELFSSPTDNSDEFKIASGILKRRYPGYQPSVADNAEKRRIAGFLQRRGFSSSVIWQLLGCSDTFGSGCD